MKKLIGSLGLVASLLLAATASAAVTQVMKGSPVIDGKKDAIYDKTIAIPLNFENKVFCGSSVDWSAAPDETSDARGTSYLMYDDNFFYVYGEVTDDDVIKNEESTAPENNPWDHDAFENWFDIGDGVVKGSVSPFVNYAFGNDAAESYKWASVKTAKGYSIEMAVPRTGFKAGDTISYVLQLNDYGKDGYIRCYGAQAGGVVEYTLGGAVK